MEIIKVLLKFLYFTCCPHPFSFRTSLFILGLMFHYIHTFIMFKHINFGKHIWIHFIPGWSVSTSFFLFFIPGWNFIPVSLTMMSSSRDEISSQQKRVNSKKDFTIDRDDFVPGRVSSRDEISRVNTLLSDKV